MDAIQSQRSETRREPTHFAYIDAVRGIAFLGVLAVHVSRMVGHFPGNSLFYAGEYGVQLFFLASAVTLCYSMSSRQKRDRYPTLYFYLRRFFRIAPLFWAAMLFYWGFPQVRELSRLWLGAGAPLGVHPRYFTLTALFLHGWHPYVFDSIVPGGWSIAVEMNFYLLFPLIFHFLGKSARRCAVAVLLAIVYQSGLHHLLPTLHRLLFPGVLAGDAWSFFEGRWLPAQLPVFLVGFLVYRLMRNDAVPRWLRTNFWAGCVLAFSLMLTVASLNSSYMLAIFGLAGSILALSGGSLKWLVNPAVRYIGRISFSCYLVHFAALGLTLKLLGIHLTSELTTVDTGHPAGNLWLFLKITSITLALTVPAATITLHAIENPGIALGRKLLARIDESRMRQLVLVGDEATT